MIGNAQPGEPHPAPSVDIAALSKNFASKNPPDNTIKRIEALEKMVAEGSGANQELEKLRQRVEKLEHESAEHKNRLTNAETDIDELKRRLAALMDIPKGTNVVNIDNSQIMMIINLLKEEVKGKVDKVDLEKLKNELKHFTE